MKILDRYILTTYLKTFFSVFIILMLIFILQTIWLYIKELAGKDLDIIVVFKFIFYFLPKLMPLVLPLTILLASIMVFGSLAENYEFAAMKSTGISLQRAMSGLSVFIVILAVITFFFSNNVIPWAELNSYNLRRNIAKLKPAMLLAEGQFNDVDTYNIKFTNKSGDNGQYLDNVTIHLKGDNKRTNATTIISKTGELASEKNSNVLKLILFDGHYYSDVASNNPSNRNKNLFVKSAFEKKEINIDLSKLNNVDFDEKSQTDKHGMLPISGLKKSIDSLAQINANEHEAFAQNMYQRTSVFRNITKPKQEAKDSVYTENLLHIFNTKKKVELIEAATRSLTSPKQLVTSKIAALKISEENINRHLISLHEKFALGFACIILFFVGAPLGALIRKGGIGLPMVIAILLFLTYHFIGIFATNSAKKGGFNPILASWFSTLVMLPLGVFLTKRATADKGLFDFDNILDPIKKAFKIKSNNRHDFKFLDSYNNDQLINLIKHDNTLGHNETVRYEALNVLNYRGHNTNDLRKMGLDIDKRFDALELIIKKDYKPHTKFAISLYTVGVLLLILHFVFKNNKLPSLASASIELSIVSLILFVIYYIKSIFNILKFYKLNTTEITSPNRFLFILGFPLYMISYIFFNEKIKETLKHNYLESLK